MKPRCKLAAAEVDELYAWLDQKLDSVGIETQPEVAMRILKLSGDAEAGAGDYARVLRNDAALSGRLIRMANSAFFAQRSPVTAVERACVVLGLQRLRAVSLGFYLARAAGDPGAELSRTVWGQSLFRACLATELAQITVQQHTAEAFVTALMLDAGIPLMYRMLGERYLAVLESSRTPTKLFRTEFETLPYTHLDLVVTLSRRWKLPELLARPIAWRYIPPSDGHDQTHELHRIAYYVGLVPLDSERGEPVSPKPLETAAERSVGLKGQDLADAVLRAKEEYRLTADLFAESINAIDSLDLLAASAHNELARAMEQTLCDAPAEPEPVRVTVQGFGVELHREGDQMIGYLLGSDGERLVSYRFAPSDETPAGVLAALGLQPTDRGELDRFSEGLKLLAA